jgi:hypothetical protein
MTNPSRNAAIDADAAAAADRRNRHDRRRHSWRTVTYGLFGRHGRRRTVRRTGHNYYLDWYHPKLVFTGIAVLLLSSLDALLTLILLSKGAYEANYFMALLLEIDHDVFIVTKVAITAFCVTFLLMHAHFHILRITSGKRMLQLMLPVYGLLIVYEVILLGVLT